jgi:hypothetical protein
MATKQDLLKEIADLKKVISYMSRCGICKHSGGSRYCDFHKTNIVPMDSCSAFELN